MRTAGRPPGGPARGLAAASRPRRRPAGSDLVPAPAGEAGLALPAGPDTAATLAVALAGAALVLERALALWEGQRAGGPPPAGLELVERQERTAPDAAGVPRLTVTTHRRQRDAWELVDRALARVAQLAEVRTRVVEVRELEERLRAVLARLEEAPGAPFTVGHRLTAGPVPHRLEGTA